MNSGSIKKRMLLKDYSKNSVVMENIKIYCPSSVGKERGWEPKSVFIGVSDKIRRELRLSKYNESDFGVIIFRK